MGHGHKGNLTLWERFFGPLVKFFSPRAREREKAQQKGKQNERAKSQKSKTFNCKKVELLDLFRKGQSRMDIEISA